MAISDTHPDYLIMIARWLKMRHCYAGEDAVKAASMLGSLPGSNASNLPGATPLTTASNLIAGTLYLPATQGMVADGLQPGQAGFEAYQSYKTRAVFPNFTSEAVRGLIGVMHNNPPQIDLPAAMEPMRLRASVHGESLPMLLRRINEQQLVTGRVGLMLDMQETPGYENLPYIAPYEAETIINWDAGRREEPVLQALNLVVLNETQNERTGDGFVWRLMQKYRVLWLGTLKGEEEVGTALYRYALYRDSNFTFNEADGQIPVIRGNPLEEIPFVFINSTDLLPTPLMPPLLELANLCLTIYRGEADYRQNLFMQGQDTLCIIGADDEFKARVGAGASLLLPVGAEAKYVGVTASGLSEQREALAADRQRAGEIGSQLLDTTSRQKESGEALRIRVAAQTATLNQIALAGAEGLQAILRIAARWIGADDSKVNVRPNLEFAESGMTPADFLALMQGKQAGLPLSDESVHDLLLQNDLTQQTWEQELTQIGIDQRRAQVFQTLMAAGIGVQGAAAGAGIPDHIAARMQAAPQPGGQPPAGPQPGAQPGGVQ